MTDWNNRENVSGAHIVPSGPSAPKLGSISIYVAEKRHEDQGQFTGVSRL